MKKILPISILLQIFCLFSIYSQSEEQHLIINPTDRTIVQKCFMILEEEKKTFCAAVGEPDKVHYAVDLSTGNIIKIWKGDFIDATTMWTGRGQEQLAEPLGQKILTLESLNPILLNNVFSTPSSPFTFKGYSLDKGGSPSFKYSLGKIKIIDHLWSEKSNTQKLNRNLKFSGTDNTLMQSKLTLAYGKNIERTKRNTYSINGKSFIIKIESKTKNEPVIEKFESGYILTIALSDLKDKQTFNYSILW